MTTTASAVLADFGCLSPQIKSSDTKCRVKVEQTYSKDIQRLQNFKDGPTRLRMRCQKQSVKQHRETTLSLWEPSVRFKGEGKGAVMKGFGALLYFKNASGPIGNSASLFCSIFFCSFLFFKGIRKKGRGLNNAPSNATCYQALNDTGESI